MDLARKYGYVIENSQVTTYVCKVMEVNDALAYKTGIRIDKNGYAPDKWVMSSDY
jgi:hypothetical protein